MQGEVTYEAVREVTGGERDKGVVNGAGLFCFTLFARRERRIEVLVSARKSPLLEVCGYVKLHKRG